MNYKITYAQLNVLSQKSHEYLGKKFTILSTDDSFRFQVTFVSQQHDQHVILTVVFDF